MKQLLFLLILFLVSCSKLEVAYDWAPRYIANYVDDNFDLSSERYAQLKKSIEADLAANKELIKSEVIQHLDTALAQTAQNEISETEYAAFIQRMQASQKKLVYAFRASFQVFTQGLTLQEVTHFKGELKERFEKHEERLADEDKLKKRFKKRFEENMESCFDDVTEQQKKIYEEYLNENWTRLRVRPVKRQELMADFEKRFDNKEELLNWVLKIYANDPEIKTSEQIEFDRMSLKATEQLLKKLWPTLSDVQKKYFAAKLTDFKTELARL